MSAVTEERVQQGASLRTVRESALVTLRRGMALSPEFVRGLGVTLLLALAATGGRLVVPIAVQQTIDRGLSAVGGSDLGFVRTAVLGCAIAVLATALCAYLMNVRLYRSAEGGLATLRTKAFRHVHDLSVLTQNTERRGALVSRVTTDVDQISQFMQWGGLLLIVNSGQLLVTTVLMAVYSWQLTLLVWACFIPLAFALRAFQRWLSAAYTRVRERIGELLGAVSEAVVGAAVVRAYGVEDRTAARVDGAIDAHRDAQTRAQRLVALTFSTTEVVAALATSAAIAAGVFLGMEGEISAGRLVAFLFLVTLFISPLQTATEVLNEAQNAIAGWRRVLGVLDTPPDVSDPGPEGVRLEPGPVAFRFEDVSFAYPGSEKVLFGVTEEVEAGRRIAVVGETGSGKTTFAKLLTRLMDPTEGKVFVNGVDLRDIAFDSLRERVVMVPQEGYLFDGSLADNVRFGKPEATDGDIRLAMTELGLADWLESLPHGLDTPVGQRGESLSAGERQLVALVRAYVGDPDLLVLDEATSAVDPATEVRLQRALEGLTRGRTSLAIAHRLSTAEAADEVIVFDEGEVVQRGPHRELVTLPGRYAELHDSWVAQQRV